MAISLDVQIAIEDTTIPSISEFKFWASKIPCEDEVDVCLRIVDQHESRELNKRFRNFDKATNVLSFPAELPGEVGINLIGDVAICATVVSEEAKVQHKELNSHWAHMLVHGILHLQGYDHQTKDQAKKMETQEIKILESLGIENPY